MTRTLLRRCLDCPTMVRGKPRCTDCQRQRDRAKAQRRPDLHADAHERERRRRAVSDHRAIVGDWCPGWSGRPAHQSADLTADHVKEVAAGGKPGGRLVVRCRSCNAARSAHLARKLLTSGFPIARGAPSTPRPPHFQREAVSADSGGDDPGPVAA
jgi:5-methylcytosine-specific restriction enzyme A